MQERLQWYIEKGVVIPVRASHKTAYFYAIITAVLLITMLGRCKVTIFQTILSFPKIYHNGAMKEGFLPNTSSAKLLFSLTKSEFLTKFSADDDTYCSGE